jgi:hypothetical protein
LSKHEYTVLFIMCDPGDFAREMENIIDFSD